MHRSQVIQAILNQRKLPTYLEIGVFKGEVFLPMRAARKVAVDPQFRIRTHRKLVASVKNPGNFSAEYFEMTSDAFFEQHADILSDGIDVAFVDGLHTYEQSYIDVQNCLKYLKDDGVIVMHDCDPPTAYSANPDRPSVLTEKTSDKNREDRVWTGDVFKALIRMRAERDDLNIFVLDTDYGLGIVRKGTCEKSLDFPVEGLDTIAFDEFQSRREELLNLKPVEFFPQWIRSAA